MDHNEALAFVEQSFSGGSPEPTKPVEASAPAEPTPDVPVESTPVSDAPAPSQEQVAEAAQELVSMDEEQFSRVDPATLPEELQPIYKSLQADYTRKTQALAEQRKQLEAMGDFDALQEAAALRARLSDPNEWMGLYSELQSALEQYGWLDQSDAEGLEEYAETPSASQFQTDDPDLAPFVSHMEQLQNQVAELQAQIETQQFAEQAEQQYNAILGELQRQENAILQSNPHYTDSDLDAIADLASTYGGDLFSAQQRYEEIISNRLAAYLQSKAPAAPSTPAPVGGIIPAAQAFGEEGVQSIDSAHAAAVEALRQMEGRGL